MNEQVVVVGSSGADGAALGVWSFENGTQLGGFKACSCPSRGLASVGADYVVAAQTGADCLQFYAWHKQTVMQRSFVPERMRSVAASPDGALVAAGGASGTIYVWDTATGRLLFSWPAHYKAVTVLRFDPSGAVLLSAGEDAVLNAWMLMHVLDQQAAASGLQPEAWRSWSDHSLPITDVALTGSANHLLALTASADHTVKVFSLATGSLVKSIALPASATCVAVDHLEHTAYVGASDGRLLALALSGASPAVGLGGADAGGARGPSTSADGDDAPRLAAIKAHGSSVSSVAVTSNGCYLLTGSQDGGVKVWDSLSLQLIRALPNPAKGPVSALAVVDRPRHLLPPGTRTEAGGKRGPALPLPLAQLCKFAGTPAGTEPWESTRVHVGGSVPYQGIVWKTGVTSALDPTLDAPDGPDALFDRLATECWDADTADRGPTAAELTETVEKLRAERDAARAEAASWKALHSRLHEFATERLLQGDA